MEKFDLSKVEYSREDLNNKITIPQEMTPELAEFLGIMVGDGHIGQYRHYDYKMTISGNIRDIDYYETYVTPLIFKLFNIKFGLVPHEARHLVLLYKHSKAIFTFLTRSIGLPINRKDFIKIPPCVMNSTDSIKAAFLRGLADADFCFTLKYKPNKYPVIFGASKSKFLIDQCSKILTDLGISNSTQTESFYYKKRSKVYIHSRVYINVFSRVNKFLEIIGFKTEYRQQVFQEMVSTLF